MYTSIIWDWNGTLLDDVAVNFSIVNALLSDRSLPEIDFGTYRRRFRMPIRDFYLDVGFSFERESFESIAADYGRRYTQAFPSVGLTEGIPEILEHIRRRGITQYIVSASQQEDLQEQAAHMGITGYFERIVGNGDRSVASKIRKAELLRAELPAAASILFIGDLDHDLAAARAMGATCALYSGGHQALAASSDYIRIERMRDLVDLI